MHGYPPWLNRCHDWPSDDSSFPVQGPLRPDKLVGRGTELTSLVSSASSGRAVVLSAPRWCGKTSLLLATADTMRAQDRTAVVVDLFGTKSLTDLARTARPAHPGRDARAAGLARPG